MSNSVLLPFVMYFNLPSCTARYADVGRAMGLKNGGELDESLARRCIGKIYNLSECCGIPGSLRDLKIPESAIPSMAESAMAVQRLLGNNPREVRTEDAVAIYTAAFHGSIG